MKKSLLVISPHPDDLEISAGLLVCVAVSKGWNVSQIIMTDGRYGAVDPQRFGSIGLIEQRKKEALYGASILGISKTFFWGIEDGKLNQFKKQVLQLLIKELAISCPAVLVAPSNIDAHPDHQSSAEICEQVLHYFPQLLVLKYSFWGENMFNVKLRAPQFMPIRLNAIQVHKSQPINIYIEKLIQRGGIDEDRFLLGSKSEGVFDMFYPYIHSVDN